MKKRDIWTIFALCVLVSGCGVVTGKGEAEKVAESFLAERISNGGFGVEDYYSSIFWENTEEKAWETIQRLVDRSVGDLKNYSLNSWKIQSKLQTNALSGKFVVLVYETEYERGSGHETLTMHKGKRDDRFKIVGHRINAPEIQKLIDKGMEQVARQGG